MINNNLKIYGEMRTGTNYIQSTILNFNNIIWSKGYLNNNYSKKSTKAKSRSIEIIHMMESINDVIFIRNGNCDWVNDLDIFSNNLDKLKNPCILITSDGDKSVPSGCSKDTVYKIHNSKTNIENIFPKLTYNYWIVS
jgi:hypothetical protein